MLSLAHIVVAALSSLSLVYESHPLTASASEGGLSVGRRFICNTEEQIKAVATSDENKISANLKKVNDQFGADSCTFATALFRKAGEEKDAATDSGRVRLERVQLVGFLVENELVPVDKQLPQYFGSPENSV